MVFNFSFYAVLEIKRQVLPRELSGKCRFRRKRSQLWNIEKKTASMVQTEATGIFLLLPTLIIHSNSTSPNIASTGG